MKPLKKILCAVTAMIVAISFAACGKTDASVGESSSQPIESNSTSGGTKYDPATRPAGKKIVIYCGGSSEYSVVKGTEEKVVKKAVEDAYYADTGISLDLDVQYLGTNMQSVLANSLVAHDQVDIVVSHTRFDSGIDDYAIGQGIYYDLGRLISRYGTNISEKTDLNTMTTFTEEIVGIPSYVNPYKHGILVRKDYMRAVGYTDDAAEAQEKGLTLLTTIEQFEDMCKKMKSKNVTGQDEDSAYSVSGAIWDIEKVFTGAFSNAGYFFYGETQNEKGETIIAPGFAQEGFKDLLQMEYRWVKDAKILPSDANTQSLEASEGQFISGLTGVFMTDPTVSHLIKVARKTKALNPEAEFTVLGPLAQEKTPEKKGFMRLSTGYKAAVVMSTSKNAEDIVKYVNWMYSDVKNYNLCMYGVEGAHWVNNGDGTYSYPEGKESYLTKAPYSGIFALVENQNMSDLLYSGYTEQERGWITASRNKDFYVDNDIIDYILPRNAGMSKLHSASLNMYWNGVAASAWSGNANPSRLGVPDDPNLTYAEYFRQQYLKADKEYLDFLTQQYNLMKQLRG